MRLDLSLKGEGSSVPIAFSDDFSILKPGWTGTGFAVSGGTATVTPTKGADSLSNGGFEAPFIDRSGGGGGTVNVADGWTTTGIETDGTDLLDEETSIVHAGSSSQHISTTSNSEGIITFAAFSNKWYELNGWVYKVAGTVWVALSDYSLLVGPTTTGAWENLITTGLAKSTQLNIYGIGASNYYIDDLSMKPLTLATMLATRDYISEDVDMSVKLTVRSGTASGLVLNLDSTSSPANFVCATHDGTNAKLWKCVAGTYTNLISSAAAYSANAALRVVKSGTSYSLYYNGAQVSTTKTVSDAGIVSNKNHGILSSYASNTFDDFTLDLPA